MPPLLVSYTGHNEEDISVFGWAVVNCDPVKTAEDVIFLCDQIAEFKKMPRESFVILSFQRLEKE